MTASSRCRLRPARRGTGSTSTPCTWPGRQPADRRPEHLDGLQGEPAHRQHHLAAGRQAQQLRAPGRPRPDAGQRGRAVRLAARPEPVGPTSTRSSTTSRRARPSCLTAGPSWSGWTSGPGRRLWSGRRPASGPGGGLSGQRADVRSGDRSSAGARCRTSPSSARPGAGVQRRVPGGVNSYRAYRLPWGDGHAGHGPKGRVAPATARDGTPCRRPGPGAAPCRPIPAAWPHIYARWQM